MMLRRAIARGASHAARRAAQLRSRRSFGQPWAGSQAVARRPTSMNRHGIHIAVHSSISRSALGANPPCVGPLARCAGWTHLDPPTWHC